MLELDRLYNMDCMIGMKEFPDNFFDIAIVDPPYGINVTHKGEIGGSVLANTTRFNKKSWDITPPTGIFRGVIQSFQTSNYLGRKSLYQPYSS